MIEKLRCVLIAVSNFDEAVARYTSVLDVKPRLAQFPGEGIQVAFFPLGDSAIELISPTRPETPLGGFLSSRGEGVFGISLEVADIEKSIKDLEAKDVRLLAREPTVDEMGYRYVYSHPKSLHGVEIEFTQPPAEGGY